MKQLASLAITAAAVAVLLVLFTAPVFTVAAAQAGPASLEGKEIFLAQKCNMCHSVPPADIEATVKSEKMKGPDLVNLEHDADRIASFLKKEADLDGKTHMKELKASEEELDALVTWLLKQQSE